MFTRSMSAYVCVLLSYLCIFYEMSGRLSAVVVVLVLSPRSRANAHLLKPISDLGHALVIPFWAPASLIALITIFIHNVGINKQHISLAHPTWLG